MDSTNNIHSLSLSPWMTRDQLDFTSLKIKHQLWNHSLFTSPQSITKVCLFIFLNIHLYYCFLFPQPLKNVFSILLLKSFLNSFTTGFLNNLKCHEEILMIKIWTKKMKNLYAIRSYVPNRKKLREIFETERL